MKTTDTAKITQQTQSISPFISHHNNARLLVISLVVTLLIAITYLFYAHATGFLTILPSFMQRYLSNELCLFITIVFIFLMLYSGLQFIGIYAIDQYHFNSLCANTHSETSIYLAGCYLSGRTSFSEDIFINQIKQWLDDAHNNIRDMPVGTIETILLIRHYQLRDSLAPLHFGIWLLPILGFIGTVLGISSAVSGLEPLLETQIQGATNNNTIGESMGNVIGGLNLAFDTTFLALCLIIPVMLASELIKKQWHSIDLKYKTIFIRRKSLSLYKHKDKNDNEVTN